MSKIKIFIVFHKILDEQLSLNQFTPDEIKRWFIPYAVNEVKIPKKLIQKNGSSVEIPDPENRVTIEYQLPQYDPMFQARGFMETSAYIHIEKNKLYGDANWIGICQYDMRWTKKSVKLLRSLEKGQPSLFTTDFFRQFFNSLNFQKAQKKIIYCQIAGKFTNPSGKFNSMVCMENFNWDYLLESYNRFFHTRWQLNDLIDQPLTLWQTYLMPPELFIELAQWLSALATEVEPWANSPPFSTHWGVLGGYTERAESLFMAVRYRAKDIDIRSLYLEHDEQIPAILGITKDHYEKKIEE